MSVTSIIFSKDRPAQLDLLLRSLKQNAPAFYDRALVVYKPTTVGFAEGYLTCEKEHPSVLFFEELHHTESFGGQVLVHLSNADTKIAFFVDDDVIYRPLPVPNPAAWLDLFPETLAFSLRLGRNTRFCYPLNRQQAGPNRIGLGEFDMWRWSVEDGDNAYPGSLDGHIFRRDQLLEMLDGAEFSNPNQLEEALMHGCMTHQKDLPHLAAFNDSVLVGIPANSVSETHGSNRHGEEFPRSTDDLNEGYLAGRRLSLRDFKMAKVEAAHQEIPLVWEDQLD